MTASGRAVPVLQPDTGVLRAAAPAPRPSEPRRLPGGVTSSRRNGYLPFAPPLIGEEEIAEVVDTLRSDWITTGPKVARFEAEFAAAVSARGALALNSCTAALHTALVVSGIGPGDEVITTPLTFAATVNVIEHVGARPVLVDVEPDTLTIDPARIAAAMTSHTKAIIPVHYAGHPAEMDPIRDLAHAHRLLAGDKVQDRGGGIAGVGDPGAPIVSCGRQIALIVDLGRAAGAVRGKRVDGAGGAPDVDGDGGPVGDDAVDPGVTQQRPDQGGVVVGRLA